MMVVAFRYITKELLLVFGAVFTVLLVIALGGRFIGYLQEAALGLYASDVLMTLLALRVPEFVQLTLPFAFFLALLMTYGRLHADQEFTVLLSSGANPARMLLWLSLIAFPIGALVGYLALSVTPITKAKVNEIFFEQRVVGQLETIKPGIFHAFDYGQRVTYTESVDTTGRRFSNVFTSESRGSDGDVMVWADSGSQYIDPVSGSRFLLLEKGTRYEGKPGRRDFRVIAFKRLGQRIERSGISGLGNDVEAIPSLQLDLSNNGQAAEMQWRVGLAVLTVIGSFCAFGLARVRPRAGRFAKIAPGMLVFFAYYILCMLTKNAVADGSLLGALGLWPVHALMVLVAVHLIRNSYEPA
jgi:lipopolysaccharide export system permease protein